MVMPQLSRITTLAPSANYFLLSTLLFLLIGSINCMESRSIRTGTEHNAASQHLSNRIHPIRRIYGRENANVREEVHKLETRRDHYWSTGVRGDSSFKVGYVNHPFDPITRRKLQANETESFMKPMRIHVETTALDSMRSDSNGAKIDFIKNIILPKMTEFWSEALSVVPVDGNLKIQKLELTNGFCGDSEFTKVPNEHFTTGVPDSDLILYISGTPSSRFCGPTTLAVAVACNWDQFDRATAGAINFCVNQIQVNADGSAHESVISDNVDVAIHEAAHVLGMSGNSYKYFWDPTTGTRRTPRPIKAKSVTCVDGTTRMAEVPAENTLIFSENNGVRSAIIVTEKVKTVAQNQFNCDEVEGAHLENQPTGSSCTGDHWDERYYYPESLSGVISPNTNVLSPLTIALMEDSGWYKGNYSKSTVSPWGHGAGCDFVQKPCLVLDSNGDTTVPDYGKGYFCKKASERGCSPTHNYKMACFFRDYSVSSSNSAPPEQFQYFSNPMLGGLKTADYCPVFGDSYKSNVHHLDCRDPANGDGVDWQGLGETFGESSTCFDSTRGEGICYTSKCVYDDFKLQVQMQGTWYECEYDFQEIDIPTTVSSVLQRKIICPRLSSVCPDMFCPANCAGRGRCNFNAEVNGVVRPQCECFDKTDKSAGCTASLELDGKYIQDSSTLINVDVKGIFDDLIAVFVDDPQEWNTASWCWASGLFGIFLMLLLCICSSFWPKKRGRRPDRNNYDRAPRRRRNKQYDDYDEYYGRSSGPQGRSMY